VQCRALSRLHFSAGGVSDVIDQRRQYDQKMAAVTLGGVIGQAIYIEELKRKQTNHLTKKILCNIVL